MSRPAPRPPATEMSRRYYALDEGRIVSWVRSPLELAEHVAKMRAAGSTHEWTANPTPEQLAEYDAREADA